MKKILVILFAILIFTGCSCTLNDYKPEDAVDSFFEKYRSKDDDIITQLKDTIEGQKLDDTQKEEYENLMYKQYEQLAYVIKDIKEEENEATATIELTVLNYRSAIIKAEEELKNNPEKFNDENGNFSDSKYMAFKIDKMKEVTETTTHTIDLFLTKENGMWKVNQLTNDDIAKLHGLY